MKHSYQFSNVLGPVYHKGNLLFAGNTETLFSPVGNRVTAYDLKRSCSQTLSVESRYNITTLALSPDSCLLILANERGDVMLVSTLSMTVIHTHRFNRPVACIRFSGDGKLFAVSKENQVFVYRTPGRATKMYNPFVLYRVLRGCYDNVTCLYWSSDSRHLAVGSADMSTRVFCVDYDAVAASKIAANNSTDDNAVSAGIVTRRHHRRSHVTAVLGGHTSSVVAVFLVHDTLDCYTISDNGQLCCWTCSHTLQELEAASKNNGERGEDDSDDDEDGDDGGKSVPSRVKYRQSMKSHLLDLVRKSSGADGGDKIDAGGEVGFIQLTAADYHQKKRLLVTAFSNGVFMLHEMPHFTHIHSLSVSEQRVCAVCLNETGDWVALACSGRGAGQLLVWEWRSETYVLKQQGHVNSMTCVAYSATGDVIATGGHDGKVKLWSVSSSFCFVTFSEHTAGVTGVQIIQSGRAVVSASLDGTVRAFDTTRYRNFRTLTSPRAVQFCCVSVDCSGELVAAGCQDQFDIYLWSLQHGKLLEVLSGHTGPVSDVMFTSSLTSSLLASTSWDKTLRLWDVMGSKIDKESIELQSEGLGVVWRPDGQQLCVSSLSGQLHVFDTRQADTSQLQQVACIETRADIAAGRSDADAFTARHKQQALAFTSLSYSCDGQYVLTGGFGCNMCLYHVRERLLVARFEVTQNRSFDAVDDFINRRKLTEFGNAALVEKRRNGGAPDDNIHLRLPGAKYGDMASRAFKPEIRVLCIRFSPTGESFGAVTTEGLLIYSLNVGANFEPVQLMPAVTRSSVITAALSAAAGCQHAADFQHVLVSALQLNQHDLITFVLEKIPISDVGAVISALPRNYVQQLLEFLGRQLPLTAHLQFYVECVHQLLTVHAYWLRGRWQLVSAAVLQLQRSLTAKLRSIGTLCDYNHYTLDYIYQLSQLRQTNQKQLQQQQQEEQCADVIESVNDVIDSVDYCPDSPVSH